ncbi:pentatricopeptide repeat-containing protein At4g18520, chloroplastic-like [Selaginella moellendorffii]|uniref:pentatricopeptide repeat-containing protein At4g18520, chloroplastic-like n=1 Tax=Selaginella moellendorffii TaxID=88036 RepID=UPI000D1C4FC5|nr:pentatricopeptide repeat-containing protein At4g18520, chloroplastic-like [Selaginella moellendorffii]|eukprot:XP_024533172.1 pentatricopeptide repeat-containing protein At4g18520, chloroplastic-like [Selaginella moellendorffii]
MPGTQWARRAARECLARARSPPASQRGGGGGRASAGEEVNLVEQQRGLIAALQECKQSRDLQRGRRLHSQALETGGGLVRGIYVATTLVVMYARCGSMEEARQVFDGMKSRNVASWTALILGYVENGRSETGLELFERMEREGCRADARTFVAGIMACGNLAAKEGGQGNSLSNGRVLAGKEDASSGRVLAAREDGSSREKFWRDEKDVKKRIKLQALERGREMHRRAAEAGCEMNLFVANTLVDMYSRCGSLVNARAVFERMPCHSLVSWTALIQGCVENGEEERALELFSRMQESRGGSLPDAQTFVAVLAACSALATKEKDISSSSSSSSSSKERKAFLKEKALETGLVLHSEAEKAGVTSNIFVANKLVDMYSKCGSMEDARRVFDRMAFQDVVTWTSLILGYVESGEAALGLELFDLLVTSQQIFRDPRFFVAGLMACASLVETSKADCLEKLAFIHSQAGKSGCDSDMFVASTLVDLYAKCGSIGNARGVFNRMPQRDVVSWTSLVLGYVERGQGDMALMLFSLMQREGCVPDARTYVAAFMACASLAEHKEELLDGRKVEALQEGKRLHSEAVKCGFLSDKVVANSLVDMYARCGSMVEARKVFDEMPSLDVVSWNSLLLGYVVNGESEVSLELFEEMQRKGWDPDARTFVAVFKACGNLTSEKEESTAEWLKRGSAFHLQASQCELDSHIFVANSLIDMYAKCGSLADARAVFDKMPLHDLVSWNTLLSGYADNGESEKALEVYKLMRKEESSSCRPDARTFVPLLKACSNTAALETGRAIHGEAVRSGVESSPFLAASLVDFYGKCGGNMAQAEQAFDVTPTRNLTLWSALMAGYGRLGDTNQVLGLFQTLEKTGLRLDGATFCSLLTACSHAGLVDRGREVFLVMASKYGVTPGVEHYHCLVDLLGRAGLVEEAVSAVKKMPLGPSVVAWKTVLAAARKWQKVEIGKMAFQALAALEVEVDEDQAGSTFALMANIYAGAEMWEEQAQVLKQKKSLFLAT